MVNSIQKGKLFEREVANLLTEVTQEKFMRVPMSGAFSTNNNSENPIFNGDVFTEGTYKTICIECKSYQDFNINDLFNHNSNFYKWVDQAKTESKGLQWLLFIKIKNQGIFIALAADNHNEITGSLLSKLRLSNFIKFIHINNNYELAKVIQ